MYFGETLRQTNYLVWIISKLMTNSRTLRVIQVVNYVRLPYASVVYSRITVYVRSIKITPKNVGTKYSILLDKSLTIVYVCGRILLSLKRICRDSPSALWRSVKQSLITSWSVQCSVTSSTAWVTIKVDKQGPVFVISSILNPTEIDHYILPYPYGMIADTDIAK